MGSFSIWHWLVIIIPVALYAGLLRAFYLWSKKYPPLNPEKPAGVAGWLLFLQAALFLSPFREAISLLSGFHGEELLYPALANSQRWLILKGVSWAGLGVFAYISISASIAIAKRRSPKVIKQTLIAIWASPILGVFYIAATMVVSQSSSSVDYGTLGIFLFNTILATFWTSYILKSKRVRNTFQGSSQ